MTDSQGAGKPVPKINAQQVEQDASWLGQRMKKSEADMALAIMENVLCTLEWSRDNREAVVEWIRSKKAEEKAA